MKELQIFNYGTQQVRTVEIDGEPWFVLKDVCKILEITNSRNVADRLDDDEKNTVRLADGNRGNPNMTIVSEAGLYKVILRSDKPEANQLMRFVTHEVLPSIRKHGMYIAGALRNKTDSKLLESEIQCDKERSGQLLLEIAIKERQLLEITPQTGYVDLILSGNSVATLQDIAKDYGRREWFLKTVLCCEHVLKKYGTNVLISEEYANLGYTHTVYSQTGEAAKSVNTFWTKKGRIFLYHLFKFHGILPVIEGYEA